MQGTSVSSYSVIEPHGLVTLGSVELTSIATGFAAVDRMVKKALVTIIDARAVCPGKFLVLITGDVASVEDSVEAGREQAGKSLTGSFVIPNLSASVLPAINRATEITAEEALGVVETFSAASAVYAADASVKAAEVRLGSLNLVNGLGGKAYYLIAGKVTDVETGVAAGCGAVEPRDVADSVVIPYLHPDVIGFLPGRFLQNGTTSGKG
jgi:microcompartment protein CcmL/EutN